MLKPTHSKMVLTSLSSPSKAISLASAAASPFGAKGAAMVGLVYERSFVC